MKLGLLPLFKPESFSKKTFTASGLEYFSANALAEIVAFVNQQLPTIQTVIKITLSEMLDQQPDIVLLWSTSACFGLVDSISENLKTYLDIPVWLAGPHISYLPQSLPEHTDLGIIGEVEWALLNLLKLVLKDPQAGAMQYRHVPGIVYQSRGRMYSGAPAQEIPNLNQLPLPNYRLFLDLPGFSAPVIRSARINDSFLTSLAYPPSRKSRFLSTEQICLQMEQIDQNYDYLFRAYSLPKEQQHHLRPVFIPDYQLFYHPQRMEALHKDMRARNLHKKLFLIMNVPPECLNAKMLQMLQEMNVRKLMIALGPFGHHNPLFSKCPPEALAKALNLCMERQMGLIGHFILNPDVGTTRTQLAQSYQFLKKWHRAFEILQISVVGPIPGTPIWDAYMQRHKPSGEALQHFPWHSLDTEKSSPDLPLFHSHLRAQDLHEIHQAFLGIKSGKKEFLQPLTQDMHNWSKASLVNTFNQTYLKEGDRILEIVHSTDTAIKPYLQPYYAIDQRFVSQGKVIGPVPQEPASIILFIGSLNSLRNPLKALQEHTQYLAADGRVYIQIINPLFMRCIDRFLQWHIEQSENSYPILKFIKEEELKHMLEQSGLELLQIDYTLMDNIEAVRPSVENLAKRLEHFGPIQIPQHMLYVSEIKMLARNRLSNYVS